MLLFFKSIVTTNKYINIYIYIYIYKYLFIFFKKYSKSIKDTYFL